MNHVQPKITILQSKGQITLPAQIRKHYNLKPGSAVRVSAQIEGIVVEPMKVVNPQEPNEFLEVLAENARANNTTVEKLLVDWKKIRRESAIRAYPGLFKKWKQYKNRTKTQSHV